MVDQPTTNRSPINPGEPSSTLRNLTAVVLVTAALNIVGEADATRKEIFRNLDGGIAAWLVCGLLAILAAAIIGAALFKASGRLTGRDGYEPTSKGHLALMFIVLVFGGVVGSAVGKSLDWQLEWTDGFYLLGSSKVWPEAQAWAGWALGTGLAFTVWAMAAQIRSERRKV